METDRKDLGRALSALKGAVSSRPGIPALSGVMVESDGAGIATLTATDLETTASARIGYAGGAGGFRALIPFRLLADTVKAAGSERVELVHTDGHVTVAGASIRLLPVDDFPTITAPAELVGTFDAAELVQTIRAVAPAASKDEARPVLTSVLLETDAGGAASMVATDSYRLHLGRLSDGGAVIDGRYLVPSRTVAYVAKLIGKRPAYSRVAIRQSEGAVCFELGTVAVTVRLIDGEFPNWRQLMPDSPGHDGATVRYDRAELAGAIKAAEPFCIGTNPVRFTLGEAGYAILSASSPDLGEWSTRLERADVAGESVVVAFQPAYIGGAVAAAGEGATMYVRDGLKPAHLISSTGRVEALVMPVRLSTPVDGGQPGPNPWRPGPGNPYSPSSGPHEPSAAERAHGAEVEDPTDPGAAESEQPAEPEDESVRDPKQEQDPDPDETDPAQAVESEPVGNGSEPWSELAILGEVDGVRVRLVTGIDGRPSVDVRRFVSSARYNGPTKKGLCVRVSSAARLAELIADAVAASETE